MPEYAMLVQPSANRVYADAATRLSVGELRVFNARALDGRLDDIAEERIGSVPYVVFRADGLADRDVRLLSNMSSLFALFERRDGLLRPLDLAPLDRFDSDLLTIQKYSGKTNEQFTKLLLNVTLLATDAGRGFTDRPLRVIDPMCGRGTTLNHALMYGFDAAGIDLEGKDVEAYGTFLTTWLKNKRLKHRVETATIRRDRTPPAKKLHVVFGATKDEYRDGQVIDVSVVHGDTRRCLDYYKPSTFDAVVTDAPYGVQHGSKDERGKKVSRSPLELLDEAVPEWVRLLRPGGAVGISWNVRVGRREDLADLLAGHGLEVLTDDGYATFEHRVDQAIMRDLIVARR